MKRNNEDFIGQATTRRIIASALAEGEGQTASAYALKRWNDRVLAAQLELVTRAGEVPGAGGTSGAWGAELADVAREDGEFLDYLRSLTVFDRLAATPAPFDLRVKLGLTAAAATFVRPGKPIKVLAPTFGNVTLARCKVAAICVESADLVRDGGIAGEIAVRDAIGESLRKGVDGALLGNAAAVEHGNPAGLLNDVTGTASSGGAAASVRADVDLLVQALAAAGLAQSVTLICHPALAARIGCMSDLNDARAFPGCSATGGTLCDYPLLTSDQCAADSLIALNSAALLRADEGMTFQTSLAAAVEQSSAPTGDALTPTAASGTLVSMYTTEGIAVKGVRTVNWALRDASAVQLVTGCNYLLGAY